MNFTRTENGIANYNLFFGTDLVVFIEGKKDDETPSVEVVHDELFYKALISAVLPEKKVKIKCVGNCDDVVTHVKMLENTGTNNGFGIIDRDSCGILYSSSVSKRIIFTKGYSWENDLWTLETIARSVSRLIFSTIDLSKKIKTIISRGMKRLKLLCRLDFAMRVHEKALFKKNRRACGIGFDTKQWGIPQHEIKRLIKNYKSSLAVTCDLSKLILNSTKNVNENNLVQGHLKNSLICNVIATAFQFVYKKSGLNNLIIMNTALSVFSENPRLTLGTQAFEYYEKSIKRIV